MLNTHFDAEKSMVEVDRDDLKTRSHLRMVACFNTTTMHKNSNNNDR